MQSFVRRTDSGPRRAVIMGCGRAGASIATSLSEEGYSVTILDEDPGAFDLVPPGMIDDGHIVPVVGDGTLEHDLREASTQEADVFIAISGEDSNNALAAQIARHILLVPTVICRLNDPARREMYSQLGLITISATTLITGMVLEAAGS